MSVTMYGMTPEMAYAIGAASAMAALQLVLVVLLVRAQRTGTRLEQLTAALELLAGTTESGFVSVAAELERLGTRPLATNTGRRATGRRIASAFGRGRSIGDIAAAEGLSESEVELHRGLKDVVAALPPTATDEAEAQHDSHGDVATEGGADRDRKSPTRRRRSRPQEMQHADVRV